MSLKYRADIDGLRAVAVLLVVLYHAQLPIHGGFVGVDVFFVISGFLITSIIRKDILLGKFSYADFYTRRIKRILPAFVTVMISSIIIGFFILLPEDLIELLKSSIASLLSFSNFFFYANSGDYFSTNVNQIPLLHTWSLSVEEQYYIIVPVVIYLIQKKLMKCELLFFGVATIILFAISEFGANTSPSISYYMLPYRAFELMIGSFIAIISCKFEVKSTLHNNILSFVGLVIIISYSFILTKNSTFPGYNALMPCIGAAMIIFAGIKDHDSIFTNRLLSLPPFVFIGKISYPLYLWHWPLIAFANYKSIEFTFEVKAIIIFASIILSIITNRVIENRFRNNSHGFAKSFSAAIIVPVATLASLITITISNNGFPGRLNGSEFSAKNKAETIYKNCYNSYNLNNDGLCILGDTNKKPETILIGDSMAGSYMAFVDYLAKDAGISVLATASSALPAIKNIYPLSDKSPAKAYRSEDKLIYNDKRIELAKSFKNVIIAGSWGNWDGYYEGKDMDIPRSMSYIKSQGAEIFILLRPNGATPSEFSFAKSSSVDGRSDENYKVKERKVNAALEKRINELSDDIIIDPNKAICTELSCEIVINGRVIYSDPDHLNVSGARDIAKIYLAKIGNPFIKM